MTADLGSAQERGEVKGRGHRSDVPDWNATPNASDIGLKRKDIHEARKIRDAEKAQPGIIRRTLNKMLNVGEEPTRAAVMRG